MLSKKEVFLKAYKKLEKRRLKRKILQQNNLKIAFKICPEIEMLHKKLNKTSISLIKLIYKKNNNFDSTLEKIKKDNIIFQTKIKQLLKENNLPENFLNPSPFCKICQDYGVINNSRCFCLKKIVRQICAEDLIKNSNLPKLSFENFNLNFYSTNLEENEKVSAFKQMSAVFLECKKYSENFNLNSGGLLLHGLTGLGKTHLSLAIAFKIIEKGFKVLYQTASQITRNVLNIKFLNNSENSYFNLINEADLLIVDDLGCEFQSQINKSAIFETINLRTSFNKPLIINTNLNPEDLEKNYGFRITSRIISNLKILSFIGKDNRQKINFKNFRSY